MQLTIGPINIAIDKHGLSKVYEYLHIRSYYMHPFNRWTHYLTTPCPPLAPLFSQELGSHHSPMVPKNSMFSKIIKLVKATPKKYQMKVFICHYNTWMGKINKKTNPTRVVSHYALPFTLKGYVWVKEIQIFHHAKMWFSKETKILQNIIIL